MKSFVISKRDAGTRVDRFIEKTFESVPKSLMYKEIRKKNIKVNKKRCTNDQKLNEGDLLELYLKDDVLKLKVKHLDFMKASDELDIVYEDENVIIVEDIIDSGNTLSRLVPMLQERGPKDLRICTLLSKPERREVEIDVAYNGFEIPDKFVVGYGLDYDQHYRNLPYVGVIESE